MLDLSKWRTIPRHELSEAWGDMSEVEFEGMLADMKQHGYDNKQAIWLYEGRVLDGWHRLRAAVMCCKNMPTFETYKGDDPQGFVVRRNLLRRHLDTSQRGLIAGRISNIGHGGDRKTQDAILHLASQEKLEKAAADLNVSHRTASSGKKVAENGTPVLQEAVMDRTVSVSDAAAIADEPAKIQNAAVKNVRKKKSKTVKAAATAVKGDADEGDLEEIKDAEGNIVPKDAVKAFQAAKDLESVCRELDKIIGRVEDISNGPGGRLIRFDSFKQQLKDAKGNLWANRATHVCPYCQGKKSKCDCCKGEGWTAKHIWQAAPGANGKKK